MPFKKSSLLTALFLLPIFLSAQSFNSNEFNTKRLDINKKGMTVLGSWAIANIAYSGTAVFNNTGENKAFHQMNIGWGAINLALAGVGYLGNRNASTDLSSLESARELESMKRIFLFNAGLDLAYVAGGAYLTELSKNTTNNDRADQFAGFGKSVMLQGGFLFVFDLVMFYAHNNHGKKGLYNSLSQINLSPNGFYMAVNF